MVRNHQGNKQPIEPSLVNQTTSKADYTTFKKFDSVAERLRRLTRILFALSVGLCPRRFESCCCRHKLFFCFLNIFFPLKSITVVHCNVLYKSM